MSPVFLIPNLGGEEDRDWQDLQREPAVALWSRLWHLLFARSDVLESPFEGEPQGERGPGFDDPVFPWLSGEPRAIAWLPNPSAHAIARDRALALDAPSWEVVARVHDKAFAHRFAEAEGYVPRPLRGLASIFEPADLLGPKASASLAEVLRDWPAFARESFVLKPRFGSSARGRVGGDESSIGSEAMARGMERLARRGGALLEPWLARYGDYSVQLHVDRDGALTVLGSLVQVMATSGQLLAHRGELDSRGRVFTGAPEEEELREAAAAIGNAAAREGFFGPCGVDACAFRAEGDRVWLRPLLEFNARFTIGTIVVGLVRRHLKAAREALDFGPGDRVGFLLAQHLGDEQESARDASIYRVPLAPAASPLRPALLFARSADALDPVESSVRNAR